MEPVDIIHIRDHKFVKRGKGGPKAPGCEVCRRGKVQMVHVGTPESLNVSGSAGNAHHYQGMKKAWEARLAELLEASRLPKGLGRVEARGQLCFGDRRARDQGNYRFMLEKALGDALVAGGWLEDDDWSRYEFGRLAYAYEKGASWTALTLYPSPNPLALDV